MVVLNCETMNTTEYCVDLNNSVLYWMTEFIGSFLLDKHVGEPEWKIFFDNRDKE